MDKIQLSENAARHHAWFERANKDGTPAASVLSGSGADALFIAGAIAGPVALAVAGGAVVVAACSQVWLRGRQAGWNRSDREDEIEKANRLRSNIIESIEYDIVTLYEIEVYIKYILKKREQVEKKGRISSLMEAKIVDTVVKMVATCKRLRLDPNAPWELTCFL